MEPEKDIFTKWSDERKSRPWYRKIIDRTQGWWEFEARYYWKDLKQGIKNLWYWLPVIWKDRNWDHDFIFDVLSHKLKAQASYIGKYGLHLNNWKDERDMMICVRLIEKVKTEYYSSEYQDYHKLKTWFEPCKDKPGYSEWKSRELEENFDDYFKKYPLIYKRVINGQGPFKIDDDQDKARIASGIGYINHQRARKLLFKIMEQEIERWWD